MSRFMAHGRLWWMMNWSMCGFFRSCSFDTPAYLIISSASPNVAMNRCIRQPTDCTETHWKGYESDVVLQNGLSEWISLEKWARRSRSPMRKRADAERLENGPVCWKTLLLSFTKKENTVNLSHMMPIRDIFAAKHGISHSLKLSRWVSQQAGLFLERLLWLQLLFEGQSNMRMLTLPLICDILRPYIFSCFMEQIRYETQSST